MFRTGSHTLWLLAAAWVILCAAASPPASAQSVDHERSSYTADTATRTGIDLLEDEGFARLRGKRVGLVTNQTGVDSAGRRTIDLLAQAPGVRLVALFSPEHGIAGSVDAAVGNSVDTATQLPIYSLYGETRRPTAEMLKGLDALVFDLQDAGVRFYTYITTMAYCMEATAAAQNHVAFIVLDRPDPLGGEVIEGPMLDRERLSFVGYFPMPLRYAMTLGELARMFNAENKIGADLQVVAMKGWRRSETYGETGLNWIAPSPNLRTLRAAFLYPGIEILQSAGVSVGRGTEMPFELFGAPWMDGAMVAAALNALKIPGVSFAATRFTPRQDSYKDRDCYGVAITLSDQDKLRPVAMGLAIAQELRRRYPGEFHVEKMIALLGSQAAVEKLSRGDDPAEIVSGRSGELAQFRRMREKYLLYH
jgi:uncharacterized protein YbbC (DUF1343 family)